MTGLLEAPLMGYPTKIQLIKRKQSEQWYINFPVAVAQAMELERGETVEWIIEDMASLVLRRQKVPPSAMKKPSGMMGMLRSHLWGKAMGVNLGGFVTKKAEGKSRFFRRILALCHLLLILDS